MIYAVISMAALGAALGAALAYAARRFYAPVDPLIESVAAVLPGGNCGGCGFAGCGGFAEAVAAGTAEAGLCAPGGAAVTSLVNRLMGKDAAFDPGARPVAVLHCRKQGVARPVDYLGPATCRAASLPGLSGGPSACRYGCLGFGDCLAACPFGALTLGSEGEPVVVDEAACVGCQRCRKACPRGLFSVAPLRRTVFVSCRNRDKGPRANQLCAHACVACRKCEKSCPHDAIHVPNFLAEIDYAKCVNCGVCVAVCPRGTLTDRGAGRAAVLSARGD